MRVEKAELMKERKSEKSLLLAKKLGMLSLRS